MHRFGKRDIGLHIDDEQLELEAGNYDATAPGSETTIMCAQVGQILAAFKSYVQGRSLQSKCAVYHSSDEILRVHGALFNILSLIIENALPVCAPVEDFCSTVELNY